MNAIKRHIAIVDPSNRVPELDSFNRLASLSSAYCSYHLPAMVGMDSLYDLSSPADGIVILGSGASVYDNLGWQNDLNQWIETMLGADIPILGICYGHQLLAHLFGGKVTFVREDQAKLLGLRRVTMTKSGFWGQAKQQFKWVVSHRECVSELPSDFEIIASSDEVACDGFQHKTRPIWGIQAHPDAGPGFVRNQNIDIPDSEANPFSDGRHFMKGFFAMIEKK